MTNDRTMPELPSVLLVRGCPRSGTSLLVEILNTSPRIGILSEYALGGLARDLQPILAYERVNNAQHRLTARLFVDATPDDAEVDSTARGDATANGIPKVGEQPAAFSASGRKRSLRVLPRYAASEDFYFNNHGERAPDTFPTAARFPEIITSIVEASLGKRDVRIIGSKTPGIRLDDDRATLEPLFARVRYLFVVRNPLATINSTLNRRNRARHAVDEWHVRDVAEAIREYRENMRYLLAHVARYGDDCFIVKYEDLIERFAETTAALGAFLGVSLGEAQAPNVETQTWRKSVLTSEESDAVFTALADAIEGWRAQTLTGPGPQVAPRLANCLEVAPADALFRYGASRERWLLGAGWNEVDEHGVWSAAPHADLVFTVAEGGDYVVSLEMSVFPHTVGRPVHLSVAIDGVVVFRALAVPADAEVLDVTAADVSILTGAAPRTVLCGPVALDARAIHRVSFEVDTLLSPAEAGLSEDARTLGVCLHSVLFARVAAASADAPASVRDLART